MTIIFVASLPACSSDDDPPLVFAAASLVDVMAEVATAYEAETAHAVRFSFAGSNLIANQIVAGAPANGVIVAGRTPVETLVDAGKARSNDAVEILSNRVVAVRSESSDVSPPSLRDLVSIGRIALPDPATAPAGEYVKAALEEQGVWEQMQDQIVPTLDVRAALAATLSGNVEYAFVYETDATSTDAVEIIFTIESASAATVPRYYALPIIDDGNGVERFFAFLTSDRASDIFERHGFIR